MVCQAIDLARNTTRSSGRGGRLEDQFQGLQVIMGRINDCDKERLHVGLARSASSAQNLKQLEVFPLDCNNIGGTGSVICIGTVMHKGPHNMETVIPQGCLKQSLIDERTRCYFLEQQLDHV